MATKPYLLIGNGRLSRHLGHYFDLESIAWSRWDRSQQTSVADAVAGARAVVLLISDDAIEGFLNANARPGDPPWVHCSGSLVTDSAVGAHPLMTFAEELYDHCVYREMAFVCDRGKTPFRELFPELDNPAFELDPEHKPLYHALCSVAGNLTTVVWRRAFDDFEQRLGLPRIVLYPYLDRIADNLKHSASPLTGPLARGDRGTVRRHLEVLADDPLEQVYRAVMAVLPSQDERS